MDDRVGLPHALIPPLALVVVAGAYAWPLLGSLTTATPGGPTDHDVATMVWNVGYVAHALGGGGNLLATTDVLAPFGADLRLHTYGLLQGLVAAPAVPLVGVRGAFNLMLVGTLLLNGLASYALVLQVTRHPAAALVAGVCVMLATPLLDHVRVGRPTFASVWIVAGALLLAASVVEAPRLWKGVVLGLVLVAAAFTDFQILLFSAVWLLLCGVARFRGRHAPALAAAAITALVPFAIVFAPALMGASAAGYPRPTTEDMLEYSFRIWDYVDPAVLPHAFGFELGLAALIGLIVLKQRFWLVGAAVCLLLALGPVLQPTDLPLPFAFLSTWPPLAQFRTPYRMAIPAVLGLAVVLGLLLAQPFARFSTTVTWSVAAALIAMRLAFAIVHDPLRVQTYPSYATYARIAAEPGRFTLLEVPVGVRSGLERMGSGGEVLSHYQHVHRKPLLNGMVARVPSSVFEAYRAHPALVHLSGEAETDPETFARDLVDVLRWVGAGYVLLHRDQLPAERAARIEALLDRHPLLARDVEEGELVGYRVLT